MPCVPPRLKAAWKNWACSGRPRVRSSVTTTPTLNRCSAQRNTGQITRVSRSPVRTRPVSGWRHLRIGTTTGTATAVSILSHPTNATTVRPSRSAGCVLTSTNKRASAIQGGGHNQPGAGINWRWSGSISHQMSSMNHGSYRWRRLPERQPRSDTFPESHRGSSSRETVPCLKSNDWDCQVKQMRLSMRHQAAPV
jgi:hypothetical protein